MESEILAAAAAAAAVGTFRATASRSLACAAVQHVWALYRRPVAYRLDALDDPAEAETQAASPDDPFWGVAGGAHAGQAGMRSPALADLVAQFGLPGESPEGPAPPEGHHGRGSFSTGRAGQLDEPFELYEDSSLEAMRDLHGAENLEALLDLDGAENL